MDRKKNKDRFAILVPFLGQLGENDRALNVLHIYSAGNHSLCLLEVLFAICKSNLCKITLYNVLTPGCPINAHSHGGEGEMRKDRRGGRIEGGRWEEGKRKEKRRQEEGGEIERGIRGKGEGGWKEGGWKEGGERRRRGRWKGRHDLPHGHFLVPSVPTWCFSAALSGQADSVCVCVCVCGILRNDSFQTINVLWKE